MKLGPIFWQALSIALVGVSIAALLISLMEKKSALGLGNRSSYDGALSLRALDLFPSLDRKINLLVMGVDSNGPQTQRFVGTRSDTMILVSLDPANQKVAALSIPRDTKVELGSAVSGCNKINAAYALGGPQLAVQTVQNLLGVQIDRYVAVDTKGLKQLLTELGPITVVVEKPMHYVDHTAHLTVNLEPGPQVLDADQAEGYIRYRHDSMGDIGRIGRQQWLLRQLGPKLADPMVVFKLPQLFQLADQYVVTDMSFEEMMKVAKFLKNYDTNKIATATLPGTPAYIDGLSYWVMDQQSSQATVERLIGSCSLNTTFNGLGAVANISSADAREMSRPLSIIIKYPRGCETSASYLENKLNNAGYRVKYRCIADVSECQHEEVIQRSARADEAAKCVLSKSVRELAAWPVTVAIESAPASDFTVVISPSVATSLVGPSTEAGALAAKETVVQHWN